MGITVQAFLVCNSVVIHQPSRIADIQGVFDRVFAAKFPVVFKSCTVFTRLLILGEPRCVVSIAMEAPAGAAIQILAPRELKPDLNGRIKMVSRVEPFELNQEGTFTLRLIVNGQTRSEFQLTASRACETSPLRQ
jgi:hypothetical protein